MKNVLIIGHKGFIGRKLSKCLYDKRDYRVFTTDLRLKQTNDLENFILRNKIETIVHLVSDIIPSSNEDDFFKSLENVIIPTYKLIDVAAKNNIQFVFLSSGGAIYGNHENELIIESTSRNPINYYGYSKLIIEDYILLKSKMNRLNYLILRPSNVYGEGQDSNKNQGFIAVALKKIINNGKIVVWGNGSNIKNYIYVNDLVSIIEGLLSKKIEDKIFNVGSDTNVSLNEIISVLSKTTGNDIKVDYTDNKNFDVKNFILSNDYLKEYLELSFTNFEEGIVNQVKNI